MKIKSNKLVSLLLSIILILSMAACGNFSDKSVSEDGSGIIQTTQAPTTEAPTTEPPFEPTSIDVVMIGDMLLHDAVSKSGLMADGTYNFDHFFTHIKDDVQAADIAIVNQEVILGGIELGISGYPTFNSVFEVGDAIVNAGFNVVLHATNHTIDKGAKGVDNCIDYWNTKHPDVAVLGVNKTAEEAENIYVYEQDGIKIAVLNYTYGTNGIALPTGREYIVDLLDEEKVIKDLAKANELADFVIVCPHWGSEYVYQATDYQKHWTKIFADNGCDLVLGTHPHVIEPVEWVEGKDGNKMLVYYSLGNFISTQDKAPRMLGAMANVTLENKENGEIYIKDYGVTPLVTHRVFGSGAMTTYKLSDYTEELAAKNTIRNADSSFSIQFCKDLCKQVFGELYKE